MIHLRLVPDAQAVLTPGVAMAGMSLHGRGFAHRPWSWTPPFFATNPRALWCREGMRAELLNRVQRGRTRDAAYAYGGDRLWPEWALAVCAHEGMALRCTHLASTSVALPGEDVPDCDAQAMTRTSGYAKEHRPDLTPAVLAWMVSHEGGGPLSRQRWEGHTAAITVLQERAPARLATCQTAPSPRSRSADAQRDPEDPAPNLHTRGWITRLPHPLSSVSPVITPALVWDPWPRFDDATRDHCLE